jgi:hypothetical protein
MASDYTSKELALERALAEIQALKEAVAKTQVCVLCVMCYVLCVMCYVLCVMCYVLWVMCCVLCIM